MIKEKDIMFITYAETMEKPKEQLTKMIPVTESMVGRKLAGYSLIVPAVDLLEMIEAIYLIKNDIGDSRLREHYKEKYPKKLNELKRVQIELLKVKAYFDKSLGKRSSSKRDRFSEYHNALIRIPLFNDIVYEMFYVLIRRTTFSMQKIPFEAFSDVRNYSSVYLTDKPKDEKKEDDKK